MYTVVGTTAYLLGIQKEKLIAPAEEIAAYDKAAEDKNARIIHYICLDRATLEKDFGNIIKNINGGKSIYSANDVIKDCINKLHREGIELFSKNKKDLREYIIESNILISDRINNCRHLYPDWLNWDYLREFYVMPNGNTIGGVDAAGKIYQENRSFYPYQVYCNWPVEECGNVLINDKKFVNSLYHWHDDRFADQSKVSDAGDSTKDEIYRFIAGANKATAIVDCENSDPYRLLAAIRHLNDEYTGRLTKIILIDDAHTTSAWDEFEKHVGIAVEHKEIERVLESKSQVDVKVVMSITEEYYKNSTDSFILVASDSDYWAMLEDLPEARFLVMAEREKVSPAMKERLVSAGLFYCYIDDFYSGDCEDLQRTVITKQLHTSLGEISCGNLMDLLRSACIQSRARITDAQIGSMYKKLKNGMKLEIDADGNMAIRYGAAGLI